MTDPLRGPLAALAALADHLDTRRQSILDAWGQMVQADPQLGSGHTLGRTDFLDHMPQVLDGFADALRGRPAESAAAVRDAEHGAQRWRLGYQLREVVREWGHLHLAVLAEIDAFPTDPPVRAAAGRELVALCRDGMCRSTAEYHAIQQAEAAGKLRGVQAALDEIRRLDQARADLLRETAHDLRGSLGTATLAAAAVERGELPDAVKPAASILRRGLGAVAGMLNDLMTLGRLEAGQEAVAVGRFDAAAALTELCQATAPAAADRGLELRTDGPAELLVVGDRGKVLRVAQNLLLNALRYTRAGGVTVGWAVDGETPGRWVLTVSDTGPGLPPAGGSGVSSGGEGIGLSIVKRLCELLGASVAVDSRPAAGCTFRVSLPMAGPVPGPGERGASAPCARNPG